MESRKQIELDKSLFLAVKENKYYKVRNLIDEGANPNAYTDPVDGYSCLLWAVKHRSQLMTDALLNAGARVDYCNAENKSPMGLAANIKFWYGVERFAAVKNYPGSGYGYETALKLALDKLENSSVVSLLKAGTPVDDPVPANPPSEYWKQRASWTPLHIAVEKGQVSMVQTLLQYGADINIQNNNGQTPSDLAMALGDQDCLDVLESLDLTFTGDAIFKKLASSSNLSQYDIESFSPYKEHVFAHILQINDKQIRIMALKEAKNPNSALGQLFWYQRGASKPSLEKGMLNRVVKQLEEENRVPVKVIQSSTAKITSAMDIPSVQQQQYSPPVATTPVAASAPVYYMPLYPDLSQPIMSYSYPAPAPVFYSYPVLPSAPADELQPVYVATNPHSFTNQMNNLPKVADLPVLKKPNEVTTRKYEYGS